MTKGVLVEEDVLKTMALHIDNADGCAIHLHGDCNGGPWEPGVFLFDG